MESNNNLNENEHSTREVDFGFKTVLSHEKTGLVNKLFGTVANKYDLMNDAMSLGIHRIWKKQMMNYIADFRGEILDLASGTADISLNINKEALKRNLDLPKITLCDLTYQMLKLGRDKMLDQFGMNNCKYVVANGESLPFDDNKYDLVTIAFGIRNITNKEQALKEIFRVLKPGGKFICLEFSKINSKMQKFYEFYSMKIIPKLGKLIASDQESYQYLVESIQKFPNQETFKNMLIQAGFTHANYENLSMGIVAIHYGWKI